MHDSTCSGNVVVGQLGAQCAGGGRTRRATEPMQPPAVAPGPARPTMPYMPMGPRPSRTDRGQGRTTRGTGGQRDACDAGRPDRAIASLGDDWRAEEYADGAYRCSASWGRDGQPTAPTANGPQGPVPIVGPGAFAAARADGADGAASRVVATRDPERDVAHVAGDESQYRAAKCRPELSRRRPRRRLPAFGRLPASART